MAESLLERWIDRDPCTSFSNTRINLGVEDNQACSTRPLGKPVGPWGPCVSAEAASGQGRTLTRSPRGALGPREISDTHVSHLLPQHPVLLP